MKLYLLFFFINTVVVRGIDVRVDPLVLTEQGLVRGQISEDGEYSSFLGVPYGVVDPNKPFGPALPHPGFGNEVYTANDATLACPQNSPSATNQAIDCLRLNIYSPDPSYLKNPLPVYVYIHGGGFAVGYAGEFGVFKLVNQGIVVVTINYRLGPYGFMCLNSPSAPGNQGLKDQLQALQWVKNNIHAFGGNPNNITIGGSSAGGMSVIFQLYSPHKKLFHKVIAQSGVPLTMHYRDNGEPEGAVKMAEYLGFNTTDTELALDFLASSPHNLVIEASHAVGILLLPCKEKVFDGVDSFLSNSRNTISDQKKVKNTPILIGSTNLEMGISNGGLTGDLLIHYIKEIIGQASLFNEEQLNSVAAIVRNFYVKDETQSSNSKGLNEFLSDFLFNYPVKRTVTDLLDVNAKPIYEYVFSFSENGAALHGDDMKYFYDYAWENKEQHLLSERITNLWANFIKYGNPTPQVTELLPVTWPAVSGESRQYLVIDKDLQMQTNFRKESMAFWEIFYIAFNKYM